jgi:hypothetical protein
MSYQIVISVGGQQSVSLAVARAFMTWSTRVLPNDKTAAGPRCASAITFTPAKPDVEADRLEDAHELFIEVMRVQGVPLRLSR